MKNSAANAISRSIKRNWTKAAVYENGEIHTFSKLALFIVKLSTLLDKLKMENATVGLLANVSFNWIVVYLTCLIKGISICIIRPSNTPADIEWKLQNSRVRVLFTDMNLHWPTTLFAKITMDFTKYNLFSRNQIYSIYDAWDKALTDFENTHFSEGVTYEGSGFEYLAEEPISEDKLSVIQYTAGASEPTHQIGFSIRKIGIILTNILGTITRANVTYFGDTVYFHFLKILSKIVSGEAIILDSKVWFNVAKIYQLKVIGVESYHFKQMWIRHFDFLKSKFWRILRDWGLIRLIGLKIEKRLKRLAGTQLEEIIILNNDLPRDILVNLSYLGKRINISSSYGTLESGQLISYNDYRTKSAPFSCGKPSIAYQIKIDSEDPMEIPGGLSYRVKEGIGGSQTGWIRTGDIAMVNKIGDLIVYGKKANVIISGSQLPIYPEYIERHCEQYPYIRGVYITKIDSKICGFVEINKNELDAYGITNLGLQAILNEYVRDINKHLMGCHLSFLRPLDSLDQIRSGNHKVIRINLVHNQTYQQYRKARDSLRFVPE